MPKARLDAEITANDVQFQRTMRGVERTARTAGEEFKKVFSAAGAGLAFAGFGTALGAGLRKAFDAAVNRESLELRLKSMTGSVAEASKEFQELRDLARLPGITLEGASDTFVRLRAVRIDADLAKRAVSEFGNALALVGGTDLSGVALALSQITAKGKVQAEEINQIAERVPQIRQALKDAFGTADTEVLQRQMLTTDQFLRGIIDQLGKLDRAAPGAQTQMKNFGQTLDDVASKAGKSLLPALGYLAPRLELAGAGVSAFFDSLNEGKPIGNAFLDAFKGTELAAAQSALADLKKNAEKAIEPGISRSGAAGMMSTLPGMMNLAEAAGGKLSERQEEIRRLTEETGELMRKSWFNALDDEGKLSELIRQRNVFQRKFNEAVGSGNELAAAKAANGSAQLAEQIQRLEEVTKKEDYQLAKAPERESMVRDGQWLAEQAMSMVRLRQVDPFPGLSALDRAQGKIESGSQGMSLLDNTANTVRELRDLNDNLERLLTFK